MLPPGEMEQKNYASQLDQWKAKNYKIERAAFSYASSTPGAPAAAAASPAGAAANAALNGAVASTAGNAERSYFCYGNSADRKTAYITPLTPLPASTDPIQYVGSVVLSAWTAYVHGELGQGKAAYAGCGGGGQTAEVQASREQMLRTGTGAATLTQVEWRYTGTASSASGAAADTAKELADQAKEKAAEARKKLRRVFGQ